VGFFSRLFASLKTPTVAAPQPSIPAREDICNGVDVEINRNLISGYVFAATLQLRTPLRVLNRDGEVHRNFDCAPPEFTQAQWEGCWVPEVKTWAELGLRGLPEFEPSSSASDIGVVSTDGLYLSFLVAMRIIVETSVSIESRRAALLSELARPEWAEFLTRHGGAESVVRSYFPRFVDSLRLPSMAADELWANGLRTASEIMGTPDDVLLSVRGIGPVRLSSIRAACACAANPDTAVTDTVVR